MRPLLRGATPPPERPVAGKSFAEHCRAFRAGQDSGLLDILALVRRMQQSAGHGEAQI
jgi:hypothetical protein